MYRIRAATHSESFIAVRPNGCVELICEDDHYSGELTREHSLQLAREILQHDQEQAHATKTKQS